MAAKTSPFKSVLLLIVLGVLYWMNSHSGGSDAPAGDAGAAGRDAPDGSAYETSAPADGSETEAPYADDVPNTSVVDAATLREGEQRILQAFRNQESDVLVQSAGLVIKVLPDDNEGSRHQKFILKLPSGHTLLVSHNIDLAPRLPSLRENDMVKFHGEYEYTEKGGVIHWTHHDPGGWHEDGWLELNGKKYQ